MEYLGTVQNRQVYYLPPLQTKNWCAELPEENWLAFIIADKEDICLIDEVAASCLDKAVCWFSSRRIESESAGYI